MPDLADVTLVQAADMVASGQATSLELLHACWANLDAVNPQINAVIWEEREQAEASARAADEAVRNKQKLGRLHGVPMAHKDMYYQAGKLSTCGSALRKEFRPSVTATVIERLWRGRRLYVRRPEHGGVRAEPDRSQQDVWRLPQSLEPALYHRRVVLRFGCIGRRAFQLYGAGLRHRRINPSARVGLRHHGTEADADPRLALRRDAVVVLAR